MQLGNFVEKLIAIVTLGYGNSFGENVV